MSPESHLRLRIDLEGFVSHFLRQYRLVGCELVDHQDPITSCSYSSVVPAAGISICLPYNLYRAQLLTTLRSE